MNKKLMILISILLTISFLSGIDSIAKTIKTKGDVELTRNKNIYSIATGDQLFNDDEIICKEESYAAIKFNDNSSVIKLFPNSVLVIHSEKNGDKQDKRSVLKMGELWTKVEKKSGLFEIDTPTTVASVKGTGFLLSVDENGITDLYTLDGEVQFTNKFDGLTTSISAGEHGVSNGQGEIIVEPFELSDLPDDIADFIEEEIVEPAAPRGSGTTPSGGHTAPSSADVPDMESDDDENLDGDENPSSGDSPFGLGGGIGTVTEGENFYTQIRLMPELRFGKFGLGLDIELMIDSEGKIREDDWDEWEDYINKLYYLRYGHRGDKFYGQIGAIPSYTLGQGLIMKDYTNMLHYPNEKQVGLQLGGQVSLMDMQAEVFTSNVTKNEILAGRFSLAPMNNSAIPLLKSLRFGTSIAIDRDPYGKFEDSDNDNYFDVFDAFPENADFHSDTDGDGVADLIDIDLDGDNQIDSYDYWAEIYEEVNGDSTGFAAWITTTSFYDSDVTEINNPIFEEKFVAVLGVDYDLPIFANKAFSIGHYAEVAKFTDTDSDKGAGFIFPGFYSKFFIFQMNLEYRQYQAGFIPGFFDKLYDDQRAVAYKTPEYAIITKFDRLDEFVAAQGWYGSITSNIAQVIFLTIAYEDMYSEDDSNKSLWGQLSLDNNIIPKLNRAEINYMQKDFEYISTLQIKGENAHIEGVVGYNLSGNAELVLNYQIQYIDLDNSGKIDGEDETITSMSMGVEFKF